MYYALELQKSQDPSMVELGWYTEARAMRDLNLDGWQDQYGSVIKKLRNTNMAGCKVVKASMDTSVTNLLNYSTQVTSTLRKETS